MNVLKTTTKMAMALGAVAMFLVSTACQQAQEDSGAAGEDKVEQTQGARGQDVDSEGTEAISADTSAGKEGSHRQTVEVTGVEYAFEGPDSVSAGWTTFRLKNEGDQHHFLLLYRLPEGKTREDVLRELVPVYDAVMMALQDGKVDKQEALEMLGQELPEWGFTLEFLGGPGLVAPGETAQATVELKQPGLYIMECYVKGPNGKFHSSMGMSKLFTVTEAVAETEPPQADFEISLSNAGIEAPGSVKAGKHRFKVNYLEDPSGGFPYDVHLAQLTEDTDVDALREWMDWMNVGGLRAPAPARFVGGSENMAAGNTAYFTVLLEPGRYALLSEVGATGAMYTEMTVN